MSISRKSSAVLILVSFALLLATSSSQAAAAVKPKLVVSAPTTAPSVPGKIAVIAALKSKRSANVRAARFYLNEILVTTDRRYPFKIKRGVKFDTRQLPTAKPYLKLVVRYDRRTKLGQIVKMTLKKIIRVAFIIPPDLNVESQSTTSPPLAPPTPTPPTPPVETRFGFPLALDEQFDGPTLNLKRWNRQRYDRLDRWTTDPLSTPYNSIEGAAYGIPNVSVVDGALNLKLADTKASGSAPKYKRSTGMVNSKNKFKFEYGYVETRASVSDCLGCWPTFWIMPDSNTWPPEIDIFEFINPANSPKRYPHSVVHWKPDGSDGDAQHDHFETTDSDLSDGDSSQEWFVTRPAGNAVDFMGLEQWHTYGMLWTSTFVEFYVDGVLGARVVGAAKLPQQKVYLIYQMAIGDPTQGNFGVPPAGSMIKVDYLRVFTSNP